MTRAQWLVVAFIGVIAVVAYNRTGQIAAYLGLSGQQPGAKLPGITI
ncbi:MAG: hypothetical protein HY936_01795 [Nitrosomonadales bacterium]|nr:hypothetical protein [Nitrosomonadales bacterium]